MLKVLKIFRDTVGYELSSSVQYCVSSVRGLLKGKKKVETRKLHILEEF
jgi:hypothetical protein